MEAIILNNIPFQIDLATLSSLLHIRPSQDELLQELEQLVYTAQAIGKPKAMYKVGYIETNNNDSVVVDGIVFKSRILSVNLDSIYRVFPFIATCGTELEEWARSKNDLLLRIWAETINEMALRSALQFLEGYLLKQYSFDHISMMNPGSLEDWPLQEQRGLFAVLGNPLGAIGVHLTDSLLMLPTKSVSGVWFPSAGSYKNCQLCPRENCPGRSASYDETLLLTRYSKEAHPANS
jgi:hypothetical protein